VHERPPALTRPSSSCSTSAVVSTCAAQHRRSRQRMVRLAPQSRLSFLSQALRRQDAVKPYLGSQTLRHLFLQRGGLKRLGLRITTARDSLAASRNVAKLTSRPCRRIPDNAQALLPCTDTAPTWSSRLCMATGRPAAFRNCRTTYSLRAGPCAPQPTGTPSPHALRMICSCPAQRPRPRTRGACSAPERASRWRTARASRSASSLTSEACLPAYTQQHEQHQAPC
jgi:hypothetical protein